jgi:hypothetical protein
MGNTKSRYTLAEAVEYLRRETGTPELSVHDIVTLAAEGKLPVCFSYKGQLGLFKNGPADALTNSELTREIFGPALETVYFNGILRSLSRPAPDNEITDLRGHTRKVHTLHPVRVVPVCSFGSVSPVGLEEPEGHHWRRVYGSTYSWAGTGLIAGIPDAEWMIEAESLHALMDEVKAREEKAQSAPVSNATADDLTAPKAQGVGGHLGALPADQDARESPATANSASDVSDKSTGTPPKLSEADKADVLRLYNRGKGRSVNALAKQFHVSRPTVDKVLRRAGIKK